MGPVHFDLRRTANALVSLVRDPEDTAQVFAVLDETSALTAASMLRRFAVDPDGARVLAERRDIVPTLLDRESLRRLPDGTLGRAYLDFVESEGITADGLVAAAHAGQKPRALPPEYAWLRERMRDTHDLWHVVTGYRGDVLGEQALLAFYVAQTANPGMALMVLAGFTRWHAPGNWRLVAQAFRRGRRARWLAAQPWEELLALPLDEVRRRLDVDDPPQYEAWRPTRAAA